jgi:hypothetical protein
LRARAIAAVTSSGADLGTDPRTVPVNGCCISIGSRGLSVRMRAASCSSWVAETRFEGMRVAVGVVGAAVVDMS